MTRVLENDGGLTLVELLVASLLAAAITAATFYFLVFTSTSYRAGDTSLRLQREAERVVAEVARAVREAVSIDVAAGTLTAYAADGSTEAFTTDGGGRVVRNGTPILSDARIVPALAFGEITESSTGTTIVTGVTIDLVLAPANAQAGVDPVRTRETVSVRNAATMNTPPPLPTATPPPVPTPTPILPLP